MQFRCDTNNKFPRIRLLRVLSTLCAEVQVVVHRILKSLSKLVNGFTFESDHVSKMNDFPVENICPFVKFDFVRIPLVFHHHFTPAVRYELPPRKISRAATMRMIWLVPV